MVPGQLTPQFALTITVLVATAVGAVWALGSFVLTLWERKIEIEHEREQKELEREQQRFRQKQDYFDSIVGDGEIDTDDEPETVDAEPVPVHTMGWGSESTSGATFEDTLDEVETRLDQLDTAPGLATQQDLELLENLLASGYTMVDGHDVDEIHQRVSAKLTLADAHRN
jgi:hypothetical protein